MIIRNTKINTFRCLGTRRRITLASKNEPCCSFHSQLLYEVQNIYRPTNVFLHPLFRNKQPAREYFKFRFRTNIYTSPIKTVRRYDKEEVLFSVSSNLCLVDPYRILGHACYMCGQQLEFWTANPLRRL